MGSSRATIKYKRYSTSPDPKSGVKVRAPRRASGPDPVATAASAQLRHGALGLQKRPSQLVHEMHNPPTHMEGWRPKPQIIEYLNLADFTHQVCATTHATVPPASTPLWAWAPAPASPSSGRAKLTHR